MNLLIYYRTSSLDFYDWPNALVSSAMNLLLAILRFLQGAVRKDYANLSDADLVLSYQQEADLEIIAVLMQRHRDAILGMSMKYLKDETAAHDFGQNLFMKLQDKLQTNTVRNFKSWLLSVVRNLLIDEFRKPRSRIIEIDERLGDQVADEVDNTVEQRLDWLADQLGILTAEERICIEGIYLQERNYQEIMADNGWTFNQVRGYRDRAIRRLRKGAESLSTHNEDQP